MSVQLTFPNQEVEDLFMDHAGLAVRWRTVEPIDEAPSPYEVVFPMNAETALFRSLRQLGPEIRRMLGGSFQVTPRTILYHLAFDVFGHVGTKHGALISTNLENPSQPAKRGEGTRHVLLYDVKLYAVEVASAHQASVSADTEKAIRLFHAASRYLRLNRVRLGFTPDKFHVVADANLHALSI